MAEGAHLPASKRRDAIDMLEMGVQKYGPTLPCPEGLMREVFEERVRALADEIRREDESRRPT